MSPVEREDLPTFSDYCCADCERCQEYNAPDPCPCGEPSGEDGEAA